MAKKVKLKTVQELEVLKLTAEAAYEEYHIRCMELFKKYGEAQIYSKIVPDDDGKSFLRVSIVDNIKKLTNRDNLVGISVIRPLGVKVERLKKEPK